MSPASGSKRKPADGSISPPPLRRKIVSGTTKTAIANFFTPASQKPKSRTIWTERAPNEDVPETLLVARYEPEKAEDPRGPKRRKIAAFDLDSTLITTASGKQHASEANDWKWWHHSVPARLKELYNDEGYRVIIISNQGGLTLHPDPNTKGPKAGTKNRVAAYKQKCSAILTQLDIPITLYAATGKDIYRKPRPGIWAELCDDWDLTDDVDLENSFFVGDAGGRGAVVSTQKGVKGTAKDFSCSDRNFAHNVGVAYKTPEEFFLGEQPRDFVRDFDLVTYAAEEATEGDEPLFEKKNDTDVVLFCGPPGAGKSTFFWKHLKPLGYERVNQDLLQSRDKCIKVAKECLGKGQSVAIVRLTTEPTDNTNADPATRAIWVDLAKKHDIPIRCVWFKTPLIVCEHNDAVRALNKSMNPESRVVLPKLAFNGFKSRFKEPKASEGFQDITEVEFRFRGSEEERGIWARYWV
ncbi:bifunctional polynucleotide phosphatase/kinase [Plectosphaerella plurivora]|uniref:Bifunctional polynucleotide phosphatase/kinase n=1 Tax=Plectosphaerella plurivora TaxID=936078 RepID=A0A9P8V8D7_9PEZI|nr:bifunctional polynucleotide phosphatase/kinase [Plectosphaerella plurivora]